MAGEGRIRAAGWSLSPALAKPKVRSDMLKMCALSSSFRADSCASRELFNKVQTDVVGVNMRTAEWSRGWTNRHRLKTSEDLPPLLDASPLSVINGAPWTMCSSCCPLSR